MKAVTSTAGNAYVPIGQSIQFITMQCNAMHSHLCHHSFLYPSISLYFSIFTLIMKCPFHYHLPSFTLSFYSALDNLNSAQYTKSLNDLQTVLAALPNMAEAYYIMAKDYIGLNDFATATIAAEKAASLIKRGYRLELNIIDLFTTLYDAYVGCSPPNHNGGMRAEEQILALYPDDLHQMFGYLHIKQYISSLNGLVPLRRRAIKALHDRHAFYEDACKKGSNPPLIPIRASVMVGMDEQTDVNKLYRTYVLSQTKGKQFSRKKVSARAVREQLRVGLLSGDMYYNHPMMHLMRHAFKLMRVCS